MYVLNDLFLNTKSEKKKRHQETEQFTDITISRT